MADLGASRLMLARQRGADGVVRWSAVLMREDVGRAEACPRHLGRYVLPMTQTHLPWQTWAKFRGVIPIAEPGTLTYDRERGAEWAT